MIREPALFTDSNYESNLTIHVVVIAHPDDESMFFIPVITYLRSLHEIVWILCFTTGNYDGLGHLRQQELHSVGKTDVLDVQNIIIIDNESMFPDHPNQSWPLEQASQEISNYLKNSLYIKLKRSEGISNCEQVHFNLITFDEFGVSGHCNHRDTHYATRNFVLNHCKQEETEMSVFDDSAPNETKGISKCTVALWTLVTERNFVIKYFPLTSWIRLLVYVTFHILNFPYILAVDCSIISPLVNHADGEPINQYDVNRNRNHKDIIIHSSQPWLNWKAMKTHHTQFVWYRRLFVIFSCYTYVNYLRLVECESDKKER